MSSFGFPGGPKNDVDLVRIAVGDIDPDDRLFDDKTIEAFLKIQPIVTLCAASLADAHAAAVSRKVDKSIGQTRLALSQQVKQYQNLADRLRAMDTGAIPGGAGTGQPLGGMLVGCEPAAFSIGQDDFTGNGPAVSSTVGDAACCPPQSSSTTSTPSVTLPIGDDDIKGGMRTVLDDATRDAIPTNERKSGMLVFVQTSQILYRLSSNLTTWIVERNLGSFRVVADVAERDALAKFAGMFVLSLASGIVWTLSTDLVTWLPVMNVAADMTTPDTGILVNPIPLHRVRVETPANGGSDTTGEGTAAKPFATIQAAIDSAVGVGAGKGATVVVNVGPGTFVGQISSRGQKVVVSGAVTVHESFPVGTLTDLGFLSGKRAQYRLGVGAYSTAVVEGTHWVSHDFTAFFPVDWFPSMTPALASSATPNLDRVASSTSFFDLDLVSLATTIDAPAGQSLRIAGEPGASIEMQRVKLAATSTDSANFDFVSLRGCEVRLANFAIARGWGPSSGAYWSGGELQIEDTDDAGAPSVSDALFAGGEIIARDASLAIHRVVTRHTATQIILGQTSATVRGAANSDWRDIDFEGAALGAQLSAGSKVFLAAPCSVSGLTQWVKVDDGATIDIGGQAVTGACAGTPITIAGRSEVVGAASLDGVLTNSATPGADVVVGGNAVTSFAQLAIDTANTDFALGNTSQGAKAS